MRAVTCHAVIAAVAFLSSGTARSAQVSPLVLAPRGITGVLAAVQPAASEAAAVVAVDRFALLVGANYGGADRTTLRYAGADAEAVARVMRDIGGVSTAAQSLLTDPSPDELTQAFAALAERVRSAKGSGRRVEFVFYYSGHSDESGLLFAEQHVPYAELRKLVDSVPADVSIAILDSCASGAFTRLKGGTKRAPFLVGASAVKGHAYLASSSVDEAAQESDRVGGSFFTHFLVSGLRGAADVDKDRQVTLNEAYRFAFDETLARTETTQGGPQHAAYNIGLSGSGDLVMTDLRETTATVELAPSLSGRVYIRDANGKLVAELFKEADAGVVRLALEPGTYQITVDDGKKHWRANLSIAEHRSVVVDNNSLTLVEPEATVTRGDGESGDAAEAKADEYQTVPVNIGVVPPISTNAAVKDKKVINNWSFDLAWGEVDRLEGAAFSFGGELAKEEVQGLQASLGVNFSGGPVHGAQLSIGLNYAKGLVEGGQATVGANVAEGDVHGVQLAAGGNIAMGRVDGFQGASGFNLAVGGVSGAQASAGINVARKLVDGGQVANINLAHDVSGVQIALMNVATGRVKGAQIGLVNWADDADASIGLIGLTRKGGVRVDAFTSDIAAFNLAVRFRARHTYTMFTAGAHPSGAGAGVLAGFGFGGYGYVVPDRIWLAVDGVAMGFMPDFRFRTEPVLVESLRFTVGAQAGSRFSVWGGPTFNVAVDTRRAGNRRRPGYSWTVYSSDIEDVGVKLWPGFVVGVQI